jgi:hypothetical protein
MNDGQSETNDMKTTGREEASCRGSVGGYEMSGWRNPEDASWHVKVWPAGRPSGWIDYTVAAGIFELKIVAPAHKEAVLHMIGEWEAEHLKPKPGRSRAAAKSTMV